MIRVLVVEDSPTARALLVEILGSDAEIVVVGEATNGVEALEMTKRHEPDVITMDVRMPVMDGFEATRAIMAERPTPIVVVTANTSGREVETSMQALRLGALTVLAKPPGPLAAGFDESCRRLIHTVKLMAGVRVVRRRLEGGSPGTRREQRSVPPRVVALAASTGGPAALSRLLGSLRPDFPLPILVVQHIAPGFVDGFSSWLDGLSSLPVRVAEHRDRIEARTVLVAPDDRHLVVPTRSFVELSDSHPVSGFRPSATRLFESVAATFGRTAIAVVLTGMGDDGIVGLRAVRDAGGRVIAQDEESSVVFGMPGAAVAAGLAHETLSIEGVARRMQELVSS